MPSSPSFSESVEREIITLYTDSNLPVSEIKSTYDLTNGHFYSILRRHGILRRTKDQRSTAKLVPSLPAPTDMMGTTDANGTVVSVERTPPAPSIRKLYTWEVRFESHMRVEAATITEAINEVQRLPMCHRIFNVALKGSP
jgi:hypothetical protein